MISGLRCLRELKSYTRRNTGLLLPQKYRRSSRRGSTLSSIWTMNSSTNAGQKRKRYEPPEEELSVRIGRKLHHEVKEVHKASKRAKVFETQKVVKRLKDIRKKNEADKTIVDFEAELTSLKEIDHCIIGNSALRTKILKDHTLRENEDVKAALTKEVESNLSTPAEAGTTLAKIQSRLLSSKILALQVTSTLNSLKCLLDPALKQRGEKVPEPHLNGSSMEDDDIERPSKIRKASAADGAKSKKPLAKSPDVDHAAESGSEPDGDEAGWESGSIEGEEAIEGDDDGWESGSIDAGRPNDDEDESEEQSSGQSSDSDADDEELTVKPVKAKTKVKAPAKSSKGPTTKMESTFLPSLSVGFVRGGSEDSDFSEGEDKAGGLPKKNRRGQRARRAIWEKKFGRNANHKKKEMEEMAAAAAAASNRNRGHKSAINTGSNAIPSRNFTSTQGPPGFNVPPRGRSIPQGDSGWGGRTNSVGALGVQSHSNTKSLAPKPDKTESKALHPSWEAKRRLKEKESVGIVPSQGTKIKFT